MVVSSLLCILMCIIEMIYLIGKRIAKFFRVRHENERILFAEHHEVTKMAPPRSQYHANNLTLDRNQKSVNRKEKIKEGTVTTTL